MRLEFSVYLSAHLSVCLRVLLCKSDSADTDAVLMWQARSLETVRPIHKSSAIVIKLRLNLAGSVQTGFVFWGLFLLQLLNK